MSDWRPYKTPEWRRLRLVILQRDPICVKCKRKASTHVDHIRAHKGDQTLFWDQANLQGLCLSCHSRKTVYKDGGFGVKPGVEPGAHVDGTPIDPNHPWNLE